jgi:hypothetical protein
MLKAVLRGKKEDDVNPKHAAKIRPLIKKGVDLVKRLAQTKIAIEENNARLLPFAEDLRETTALSFSIFKSDQGMVTVKFSDVIVFEEKNIPKIKKILGGNFSKMFTENVTYSVNQENIPKIKERLGSDFELYFAETKTHTHTKELRALLCDGDSKEGKKLRDFVSIEPKKPTFGYEETVKAAVAASAPEPLLQKPGKKEKAA